MGIIKVLPASLVNKIAAGEVIERPSSVAKELVENSLDSGADYIQVEIENGGRDLILVRDNGCGMDEGDVRLAFVSHATSKLKGIGDLFNIRTMGFRGEALASIGAVAQVRLTSRPKNAIEGFRAELEGGARPGFSTAGSPEGTIIEVRNLFYNVPARRKFLKSNATEMSYISEMVARLAAAHPEVAFHLVHNGRKVLSAPVVKTRRERLASVFGAELARDLLEAKEEDRGITAEAVIAAPFHTRADTRMQLFYVNNRPLRDRVIGRAVQDSFAGYIPPRRNPIAFVYVTVDPAEFDVNIHPAKAEVKFRSPGLVHSMVRAAIAQALRSSPRLRQEPTPVVHDRAEDIREAIGDFLQSTRARHETPRQHDFSQLLRPREQEPAAEQEKPKALPDEFPEGKIMQVHSSYIVIEAPEGVTIIDQHALHERILFDQLQVRFQSRTIESQRLLFPITVEVAPRESAVLDEVLPTLTLLGFEIEPFGEGALIVHSAPRVVERADVAECIHAVLEDYLDERRPDIGEYALKAMQTLACKAAVKAGQPLSRDEMIMLLEAARTLESPDTCPHGRPSTIFLSLIELERRFKRR
jgi:DNA mismatch repair protein MutL